MWHKTYQQTFTNINKETIWRLWIDIDNWPTWHDDLEYCRLEGSFKAGSFFWLKPMGMKAVKILITHVDEGKSFTGCTKFFGATMFDTHTLKETASGLMLTNILTVTGPLSWLWIKIVAQKVADSAPKEMESLVKRARAHHG